jgi:hypothetical protein
MSSLFEVLELETELNLVVFSPWKPFMSARAQLQEALLFFLKSHQP